MHSSHQNAPKADVNRQFDAIIARTPSCFRNGISNIINALEPKKIYWGERIKKNDIFDASKKPPPQEELPSADDSPIEVDLGTVIAT